MKKEIRKTGLFALIGLVGILSSCGGDSSVTSASGAGPSSTKPSSVAPSASEPDPVGGGEYTFEAEYTDVSNLSGGGISGAAVGINMILQSGNASNGWYIGYTHKKGLAITFEITSSAAAKADLTLILGTELGPMVMNPTSYEITVNGTDVNYTEFSIRANSSQIGTDFREYAITPQIDLVEGVNTLVFTTGENTYCNGGPGGPLFDAIKLDTTSTLTWEPIEDNIA